MKRFYCTICRRVKRVQKWPILLQDRESINVMDRVGECNRHTSLAKFAMNRVARKAAR